MAEPFFPLTALSEAQRAQGLERFTIIRPAAAIHRQVSTIAFEQGWKFPSYDRVRHIIKSLDPALRYTLRLSQKPFVPCDKQMRSRERKRSRRGRVV